MLIIYRTQGTIQKKIDNHQDPCYPKGYRYRSIRTSSSSPQTLNYEKERLKRTFFFLYPKVSRLSDKSEPHRNGTSTCTQISWDICLDCHQILFLCAFYNVTRRDQRSLFFFFLYIFVPSWFDKVLLTKSVSTGSGLINQINQSIRSHERNSPKRRGKAGLTNSFCNWKHKKHKR